MTPKYFIQSEAEWFVFSYFSILSSILHLFKSNFKQNAG